ncbi:hypothetical protein L1987_59152 [Smallanthus sonchifolius]|uniref:Uncharacterized protein n=1 Tax=Smallanthus sonchifolius TaxID=185202 RepID=A0ACB9D4T4_9ASTR|nr:hypothetical protein L1987_59152 [Smallanthus sonchifolius]
MIKGITCLKSASDIVIENNEPFSLFEPSSDDFPPKSNIDKATRSRTQRSSRRSVTQASGSTAIKEENESETPTRFCNVTTLAGVYDTFIMEENQVELRSTILVFKIGAESETPHNSTKPLKSRVEQLP